MKTSQSASSIEINKRDGRIRSNSGINHKKNQISSNSKSTWQLIRISKFVYYESFLEGSFKTAGRDRVLNEYKDGVSYAKQNSIMMKILASFMLIILNIITIYSLKQFLEVLPYVNEYNFSAFLFAISSISSLNCVMQLLYLFTFGMTGLMGIFGGSAFKFLETLPLENEEIEKIVFFAFLRTIDYQLIVMFLGLPIVTAFMTQNVIATVTAILVSGLHLILGISIMVFISNVMAKKIFNLSNSSKFNGFLKIFVTFLYVMITLSLGSMFSFIGSMVQTLFVDNLISGETGAIINLILSFIPYPFGLNYLYGLSVFPLDKIYIEQALPSLVGFLISIIVIILIFRKSLNVIRSVSREMEYGGERKSGSKDKPITIEKKPPILAIIKKDLTYISRDFTMMMYIMMSILFPFLLIFMMGGDDISQDPTEIRFMFNILSLLYMGMGIIWIFMAATGSESDTGGLMQILPINHREVYIAKRRFIMFFMFLFNLPMPIYQLIFLPELTISVLAYSGAMLITTFYGVELVLILYSLLFGKVRENCTLLELKPERKGDKVLGIIILMYIFIAMPLVITVILANYINPVGFGLASEMYVIELIVAGILFIPIEYFAYKIFRKEQR